MTSGRDRQTICWNYKSQEIVFREENEYEVADMQWSRRVPSVYSLVNGTSGRVEVKSVDGAKEGYAPKWYKPPVGGVFGGVSNRVCCFGENMG